MNVRLRSNASRINVYSNGKGLNALLYVTITADVNEVVCQMGLGDIEQLSALETELTKVVKKSIDDVFRVSQETGADV